MRQTYTLLQTMFLRGTQNTGATDTTLLDFFKVHLGTRYQMALATIMNYQTRKANVASTVAAQQFYHNPPGMVKINSATITIGTTPYPLDFIHSQDVWNWLNETTITTSAIPRLIFPRRDDFGIYPTPQAVYTITLNSDLRDRILTKDDVTTGATLTITNNSRTVTANAGVFVAGMVGRWLVVNDDGYWYRISGFTNTTSITLETVFNGTTQSPTTGNWRIGESPELPEEAHEYLVEGVISDYFRLIRGDLKKAQAFNNVFWTGDEADSSRIGKPFTGGILGVKDRYSSRSDSAIIKRRSFGLQSDDQSWGESIT